MPRQILSDAQQEVESLSGMRSLVKAAYRALYGERFNQKQVTVDNVQFDGQPYTVTIFKNLINKVVSDPNLSAEKMAVLGQIEQVVKRSDYTESSGVDRATQRKDEAIRYDYLTSNAAIDGTNYNLKLVVEVYEKPNELKTYLLKDMEMTPTTLLTAGTGPQSGASFSTGSVAQTAASGDSGAFGFERRNLHVVYGAQLESCTCSAKAFPRTARRKPLPKSRCIPAGAHVATADRMEAFLRNLK